MCLPKNFAANTMQFSLNLKASSVLNNVSYSEVVYTAQ